MGLLEKMWLVVGWGLLDKMWLVVVPKSLAILSRASERIHNATAAIKLMNEMIIPASSHAASVCLSPNRAIQMPPSKPLLNTTLVSTPRWTKES